MSEPAVLTSSPDHHGHDHAPPATRVIDDKRGTWGMWLFITTEAFLFVMLFFTYYYLEVGNFRWTFENPPKVHYSLPMLGILLAASISIHWGEKQVKKGNYASGKLAIIVTAILGAIFITLNVLEDLEHAAHLTPRTDSYGSIFYTITTLHASHVTLGMFMLLWLYFVPQWGPGKRSPHRSYHNVSLYWHFVDTVWVFIIVLLYAAPNVYNAL